MSGVTYLLSMRRADGSPAVASVVVTCEGCGAECWRSISSLKVDRVGGIYVCTRCFDKGVDLSIKR